MDNVVKVRRSFLNEIRAFCNVFARICDGCFHRPCDCKNYQIINRAKLLMRAIDSIRDADEEKFFVENPNEELFARVVKAIEQAGRPVRSEEIALDGVYRQKKAWALKAMLKRKRISKTISNGIPFYTVWESTSQNNNNKENNYGV